MKRGLSPTPTTGADRPRRRWRARLLALCIAAVVSFVAGEIWARLVAGAPLAERTPLSRVEANPHRGWAMLANEDHYTYRQRVRMNSFGLRGAEPPPEKGDQRRVLALGDSLIYGQGVGEEETLPYALERELELRAGGHDWFVINSGHRGYATNQELGLLRELGARLEPEVVILFWFWNDLDVPPIEAIHARLTRKGPVTFDLNAPFEGRAALNWHAKQLLRRSALVMLLHDIWRASRAGPPDPAWRAAGLQRLESQLDQFRALTHAIGATPCFVAIPEAAALHGDHSSIELATRALELAAQRDLPTLDLLPALRQRFGARSRLPILPYDGHYDPEANAWMGAQVAQWLLDEGLLPSER